jgi:hypothetical protein
MERHSLLDGALPVGALPNIWLFRWASPQVPVSGAAV